MKYQWTTLLWELWTALCLCTVLQFPPGSTWSREPAILWPGLALAVAVPFGWAVWGLWSELPQPLPPEQPLEPVRSFAAARLWEQAALTGAG